MALSGSGPAISVSESTRAGHPKHMTPGFVENGWSQARRFYGLWRESI